jgi:hypothetical protein
MFRLVGCRVSKRELMESNALTRLKRVAAGKQTTTLTHYGRKTGRAPQSHDLVRPAWRRALHRYRKCELPVGAQRAEDARDQAAIGSERKQ